MSANSASEGLMDNDDDLEKFLADAENLLPLTSSNEADPKNSNFVPQIREDETFAELFTCETCPPVSKEQNIFTKEKECEKEFDSSDDEDIKNFLERKYNEYGRDINKKLKEMDTLERESQILKEVAMQSISEPKGDQVEINQSNVKNPHNPINRQSMCSTSFMQRLPKENLNNNESVVNVSSSSSSAQASISAVYTDPVFGLRLINPLISSTVLTERMDGRKAIPFSSLTFHIQRGDLKKDWVVAGVVVSKSPIKTSKNGSLYSLWKLSDLKGDIKMISLFLFNNAHKDLWKTSTGTAIAILNPSVLEKRSQSSEVATLAIDSSQKILILGESKDLGFCKAKKKSGDPCMATINLGNCDTCIYHMKQEYQKLSTRAELQSSTCGRGLNELRNKILGRSEVFYAGKSFLAVPAKKSAKLATNDAKRLSSLSEYAVSPFAATINHVKINGNKLEQIPYAKRGGPVSKIANNLEITAKQREKDIKRLKILQAESSPNQVELAAVTPEIVNQPVVPKNFKNRTFSFANKTPQLKREGFSFEITVENRQSEFAKLKAAQIIKQKPIVKANPNILRGTAEGRKRAIDELNAEFDTAAKRYKKDEDQKQEDRKTRIQKILEATSSHADLVEARRLQDQEKYFNKLEKKEALEEKMLNTFKVPCKAVICKQCNYTAFSAADRCKEERHSLKVIDTEKRFFQCKDCGNRTITLHKMPTLSCKNCSSSHWQRTGMIRERKIFDGTESLSIRGDEEMFISSLSSKVNLSLLVPEE